MTTKTFSRIPYGRPDDRADQSMVPMRDGVRLATDVYLPPSPTRLPAVLIRLPYDKSGAFSFMAPVAERLTARGMAVVVQDVRGKVRSEGETLAFVHEVADGYDTLEWLVAQRWSDGTVAMFGDSYYGWTQWAALASGHPALRAMVPRMTTTEVGSDWMHNQGVFCLGTMLEWAVHAWVEPALLDHRIDWSVRPVMDIVPASLGGLRSRSFDSWASHGPRDDFWTSGLYGSRGPAFGKLPTLHVGGFYDVFSRGQLRDHRRSCIAAGGRDQYLVMGAMDHFDDELTPEGRAVDYLTSGEPLDAFLDRYLGSALPFLDRHLLGRTDTSTAAAVTWQLGTAGWREAGSWPPEGARPVVLHLADGARAAMDVQGGALTARQEALQTSVEWEHDPVRPVPSLVADPWRPLLRLPDEREVQVRDDVVTFTAMPQEHHLDLAGPVTLVAVLSAEAPSTHLVAKLVDVDPAGVARMVVEGAVLVHEADYGHPTTLDLGDTGYRVEPGHRLRLQLSSSSYPRWVVHPGTADAPFTATRPRLARQRLRVGGSTGARLILTALVPVPDH